jgi:hypothetical protein
MHASQILQKYFVDVFAQMHAGRVRVVVGAVVALMQCRRLVLMELARAWPGAERVRAPLKKLDRLLSNPHLKAERSVLYEQIVRLCVRTAEPIIVVDWSTLKADESWHLLRAALALKGRTLTLYEEVHPQQDAQSPRIHRAFLKRLHQLMPSSARPIIVTDAGFQTPWFAAVEALGWHFVGRVRNRVNVKQGARPWKLLQVLMMGTCKVQCFGAVHLARRQPYACQLLRYRQDRYGRKHRRVRGKICSTHHSRAMARGQREPWMLAYSNGLSEATPLRIVNLYRQRMQIELSFRDLKSQRYGCGLRNSLTRKGHRLAALLLLHALASLIAWLQGIALTHLQRIMHCAIRSNAPRASYSVVRIGWESLRRHQPVVPLLAELSRRHLPTWLAPHLVPNL